MWLSAAHLILISGTSLVSHKFQQILHAEKAKYKSA